MTHRFLRTAMTVAAASLLAACSADFTSTSPMQSASAALARGDNAGDKLPAPAAVTATVDGDAILVSWTAVDGAGEYQVKLCSSDASCLGTQRTTGTSIRFTAVPAGSWTANVRARRDAPASETDENNGWGDAVSAASVTITAVAPVTSTDATAPVITYTVAGTQSGPWYRSDVTVTWTVTDAESAISGSTGCEATTVTQDGVSSLTCSATSAGGTSSASVTIRRDVTLPVIAFAGNAATYTVDQSIAITCSATDATSGVATTSCPGVLAAEAWTLALGAQSAGATATDVAGNTATGSASFTVTVTHESLCALVRRWVANTGVANSLCVKLAAAARATARGSDSAAAGSLGAFSNEVRAQSGKWIPADKVAYLTSFAAAL